MAKSTNQPQVPALPQPQPETKAALRVREQAARDALANTLALAGDARPGDTVPKVDRPGETEPHFNRGLLFAVNGHWYKASVRAYDPAADAGGKDE